MEELQTLVNQFESSFNFYILKNNYGFDDNAKEFLDKYKKIKNHMYFDDEAKYKYLSDLLKDSKDVTISTMQSIKKINHLWKPDFDNLKRVDKYYIANLPQRSKTVCEAIQQLFENPEIRKNLSTTDLYNLYGSYRQISNYIKDNKLTNEILDDIEKNLGYISKKIWTSSITNPEDYKSGEPFMFIVHNVSKTDMETTNINEHIARSGRVSASLITDKEMGVYGAHKYGFIYPSDSKIVTAGYKDLYSYETKGEGRFYQNSNNSMLITPQAMENYSANLCIQENGKKLNNDNANIYNEVLLDSTNGLDPVGIYCITFGEKELSYDYESAKKLAEHTNLPLIDIDISLYRTKENLGTYLTDEEALSVKEQKEFAERFLKQYYKSKNYDLKLSQDFTEADLELYQDMIVDIFLNEKKNNNISKENLFKIYEEKKQLRKNKAENYNTHINEMSDLKESLDNFKQALSNCDDEEIRKSIIEQSNKVVKRMKSLNRLIENTDSIGLSADNYIYQSNPVAKKIMGDFSPFNTETIVFNDEKITIINGYKSKQELEKTKQEMLSEVDLSHDSMQSRLYHAKRVIEVEFNGYETNSTNIDISAYKQKTPELAQLKAVSKSFVDISSLDKNIKKYDELLALKQQLTNEIQVLSENRRIFTGSYRIELVEQQRKECADKIEECKKSILSDKQELNLLHQRQDKLMEEKSKLDKKSFLGKIFANKKINENTSNLSDNKNRIEKLEYEVRSTEYTMKSEKEHSKFITDNFLLNYGLDGMTLEDYKKRLETLLPDAQKLSDSSVQYELEKKLEAVDQKISEMQIDKHKEYEMREKLEQKKVEVGLSVPKTVINSDVEEHTVEKSTGVSNKYI